jgi:hypothetical protein
MNLDWDKHLPSFLAWGGALLTGLFAVLGVWISNRSSLKQLTVRLQHEADRDARQALRQRLEELYSLVGSWSNELVTHYMPYLRVMDGVLTYNQALDITIKRGVQVDSVRMFTLAELYFPSTQGALGALMLTRDKAARIHDEFKENHKVDGLPNASAASALRSVLREFSATVDDYKAELATYAKNV